MRAPVHTSMVPDLLPTPPILDHWELFSAAYVGRYIQVVHRGTWRMGTFHFNLGEEGSPSKLYIRFSLI